MHLGTARTVSGGPKRARAAGLSAQRHVSAEKPLSIFRGARARKRCLELQSASRSAEAAESGRGHVHPPHSDPILTAFRASTPLSVVLDTQCVLDWAFFADPRCALWGDWHNAGTWRWLATAEMRAELDFVLQRGLDPRWCTPASEVLDCFDRRAQVVSLPPWSAPTGLRCTDASDQKFIDLALQAQADVLVSRDRAVLKLHQRARLVSGLQIMTPDAWTLAVAKLHRP